MSTELETLSKIGLLRMGETIIEKDCSGDGLPIYSADKGNRPWAYSDHFRRKNEKGSIVIGSRGTIGYPRLPKDELFGATQTTIVFSPDKDRFIPEFLHYWLQQVDFESLGAQQAVPMLTVSNLENLTVRLFKKSEQSKIAEILSTVDQAIDQTEALITKQQRIRIGLMQDMLTHGIDENGNIRSEDTHKFKDSSLGRIPVEWKVERGVSVCDEIVVGIVIRPTQYYREDGIPTLRSANIQENRIDPSHLVYMSVKDNAQLRKSQVRRGDLVTVRTGYPGATTVIPPEFDGCNCVDIVISRPNSKKVRSQYLSIWINSYHGKLQILKGQGGLAQQHFNVSEMKNLLIKVPMLNEQERIETLLLTHAETIRKARRNLAKLEGLKTALMQDLLTGKVSVTHLLTEADISI
ncbi:MAG: restriction endonuclease subunit S [Gemmatimonadetes bacterium]|nr:restriction endonuclease subunit S [Gemmatimonadota bacterium]